MKKQILALGLVVLLLAGSLAGCKKGSDDPFLSLLSRKARLTGVWEIYDANYSITGKNDTSTYTYDNESGIMTDVSSSNDNPKNYLYSKVLTINKDYSFTEVETINDNGIKVTTKEGYWFFAPENDDLDIKNKERVVFQITKVKVDNDGNISYDEYDGSTNAITEVIDLTELSNKQISINLDYTRTDEDGLKYQISGFEVYTQE